MAGKTFRLTSDMQFVHTNTKDERSQQGTRIAVVYVSEYKGNPHGMQSITEAGDDAWLVGVARLSNDKDQLATHDALDVNGVTVKGELLTELFNDLAVERETDRKQQTFLMFNRKGQFLVNVGGPWDKKIQAHGMFQSTSWSKYGFKAAGGEEIMKDLV